MKKSQVFFLIILLFVTSSNIVLSAELPAVSEQSTIDTEHNKQGQGSSANSVYSGDSVLGIKSSTISVAKGINSQVPNNIQKPSVLSNWPVVILSLLFIVFFIVLLAWLAKRFSGLSTNGSNHMKVVSAIPVGTRERIAIIDVKGQQFMVGITAQQINLLHPFDQPVVDLASPNSSEFAQRLQSLLKTGKKSNTSHKVDHD